MRTKLISSTDIESDGYGAGPGNTEWLEYECPCKKGKIIEIHDNIPGDREHTISINCDECSKKYEIDTSQGTRNWQIIEKNNN